MEFTGRIMKLLPRRSGVSERTGKEWAFQPFIFEYFEQDDQRYSDKVLLETMDTSIMENMHEGDEVRIGFGHNVREYDNKYYNNLSIYRFEFLKGLQPDQSATQQPTTQQPETQKPATQQASPSKKEDDLPF